MTEIVLTQEEQERAQRAARRLADYRRSIRLFVKDMWGLSPQPVKPAFKERMELLERVGGAEWKRQKDLVQASWFLPYEKGKHISWQQNLLLMGIEKAIAGDAPRKLSVVSGHGTGKSASCSWITLWFLYCFFGSQIPVTAPTSSQMHDVLWKELSIWISRMPESEKALFEWSKDYVRMNYDPNSWFARARTSTKENTEAIAGVHADHVAIIVDEASGVPEQVFVTAQGALTSGNVLVVLISNGTRNIGYFYDSHHKNADDWQTFAFDSEESPLVNQRFVDDMEKQYGRDSEEFRVRVKGRFPMEGIMDDSGYIQLIPATKIIVRAMPEDPSLRVPFLGRTILGLDPSGEGKDKATWVARDRFKARVVHELATTNDKEMAEVSLTLMDRYQIAPEDFVVGSFGKGSDVGKEIAIASQGKMEVYTVLEGNTPEYEESYNGRFFERHADELQNPDTRSKEITDLYLNVRALMWFRAMKWLVAGGVIEDVSVESSDFAHELQGIRYKRSLHGNKIQLMSKKEMLKLRIPSPNKGDAFALTHLRDLADIVHKKTEEEEEAEAEEARVSGDDRFSSL